MNGIARLNDKMSTILASEDRIRMTRLYEEVFTRLEEMAMITARALKMGSDRASAVKFNPLQSGEQLEYGAVEIVSTPYARGCYDYRQGACFGTIARHVEDGPKRGEM